MEHSEKHYDQPPQDSPKNEAALGTCAPKSHTLHPDKDNGSESRGVNRHTIDDEGADPTRPTWRAVYTPARIVQSADASIKNRSSSHRDSHEDARGERTRPRALITSVVQPRRPAGISRGVGLIEAIFPIDEDWVIVDDDNNPVSQIALSSCQHKLRSESQGAPLLIRTSSSSIAGEPQLFSYIRWSLHWPVC